MNIIKQYKEQQSIIKKHLQDFKSLPEQEYLYELFFCLLTPQSNAKKCWQAVEEIKQLPTISHNKLIKILKSKTRFHNNKANYILNALHQWPTFQSSLNNPNRIELRNNLSANIKGLGLKEASHFLRNIGKSDNQIAILDRHILKNLKTLKVIQNNKIKNKADYLNKEKQFIAFSNKINIPLDSLDLLFWSKETGEVFK